MADHIQIGDVSPRVRYTGDGATLAFTYPFPIFTEADLEVYIDGSLKTLSTDYSVSGAGQSTGGSVTFLVAPTLGAAVTMVRRVTLKRTTDFQASGEFRAKVINDELDFQTAALQQLADDIDRSLRLSKSDAAATLELPSAVNRADKLLAFDANGNVTTATPNSDTYITLSTFAETLLDDTDAGAARATLGLEVGTDIQAYDGNLAALAGLTPAANKVPYFTASGTAALLDFKDEDDLVSDSATAVPSQQSVKAYVDAAGGGNWTLVSTSTLSSTASVEFSGLTPGAVYKIECESVRCSSNWYMKAQFGYGEAPTYVTSSQYYWSSTGHTSQPTAQNSGYSANDHCQIFGGAGSLTGSASHVSLDLAEIVFRPGAGDGTNQVPRYVARAYTFVVGYSAVAVAAGMCDDTAFDSNPTTAIKLYPSAGTLSSGVIRLYERAY